MKCKICNDELDTESPYNVYGKNPLTFRNCWMHGYCFDNALNDLKTQSSKNIDYENKYDEYLFSSEGE